MAEKMISEILAANCKLKTNNEKVQHLQKNDCRPLRNILKGLFDEAVKLVIYTEFRKDLNILTKAGLANKC